MKEATGELNMTVVTIVAIAALLAFFYAVIWPNLQVGMSLSSACSAANGTTYSTEGTDSRGKKWEIKCSSNSCTYESDSKKSSRTCSDNK